MIDLVALRSLEAVDRHGSVSAAAQALGFTPSAVSQQIKRLEQQAGMPLLERVGRGVVVTGHGRRLVGDGSRIRADLERLESELLARAHTISGELTVVGFSTAMRGLIATAAGRVQREHPDLALRLAEVEPWDAVDRVTGGEADLGIVHQWGDVPLRIPESLQRRTLMHDRADVIVPVDHPLGSRRTLSPRDLVGERWIATPDGTICRQWLARMYVGTGAEPVIAHTAAEFDSHLALVAAGLGIALIPRLGRFPLPEGTLAVPVHDPVPEREVTAVWRRSQDASPGVHAFVEALVAAAG